MAIAPLVNPSFETGDFTGWEIESTGTVNYSVSNSENTPYGTWALRFTTGTPGVFYLLQDEFTPVWEGKQIKASCNYSQGPAAANLNTGRVVLKWYDENDIQIGESPGTLIFATGSSGWNQGPGFVLSQVTAAAPAGAAKVKIGLWCNKDRNDWCNVDNFVWDYELPEVTLTYPLDGVTYSAGAEIPFRVTTSGDMPIAQVEYVATNTLTSDETIVGPVLAAPWAINSTLPGGTYDVIARVTYTNGFVLDSAENTIEVGTPPPPDTREYRASNAYTNLIAKNFVGLAGAIPPTANVVGMETVIDYNITAIIRSKDIGVPDLSVARYSAAFEMAPSVTFETVLLQDDGTNYTSVGGTLQATENVVQSDFSVTEDGTSEGKRWTVLEGAAQQVTIGGTAELFGLEFMQASEFVSRSLGLRFFPNLTAKPDYADAGDAAYRVNIDKLRVQIYFDAGSVEYYFVSPDESQVIKGRLAAAYVDSGSFTSGDAAGVMQMASDLEVIDGDPNQRTILADWTIHSAYPPTDANQIGVVESDMSYNGLPAYWDVEDNRSRYQFISANFYGDLTYDSVYGVNGVDRAFSYNGDFFYKIHTQPDAAKDKPRHVEFYHTHLALGYGEGRVDVSVVGQPYNFDGALGASSWAIGDAVTGLQNLSGTMLGIFCRKSIHGLAGTTVDNFATQVLSPKIGAVEYTVTDMGFPVYANAYGIYTLAQTNQYGDYLGTPMSQDISPWLRPRLVRKTTSPREVVVAWPVRAKNQYRLAFADGYVLTMTINNGQQAAPTFSKQKYFATGQQLGGCTVLVSDGGETPRYGIDLPEDWPAPVAGDYLRLQDGVDSYSWYMEFQYDPESNALYPWTYVGSGGTVPSPLPIEGYLVRTIGEGEITNYNCAILYLDGEQPSDTEVVTMYNREAMVPAAVSSELDDGGEERIHIAPKQEPVLVDIVDPGGDCTTALGSAAWGNGGSNFELTYAGVTAMPDWLAEAPDFILIDFFDTGNNVTYAWSTLNQLWERQDGEPLLGPQSGRGTIYSEDMSQSVCFDWQIPTGE